MGIVDHYLGLTAAAEGLHSALHGVQSLHDPCAICQRYAARQQNPQHAKQIGYIEAAKQRTFDACLAPLAFNGKGDARGIEPFDACIEIAGPDAVTDHLQCGGAQTFFQLATEWIVDIQHRCLQAARPKQPGLRFRVGFHGAVVIEMVAREVGEQCHIELDARHAPLVETMA